METLTARPSLSSVLFSAKACEPRADFSGCRDHACTSQVAEHNGRFFITFGHAGFNSPANNRNGYATEAAARAAVARYLRPRR